MTIGTAAITRDTRAARWLRAHPQAVDLTLVVLVAAFPLVGFAATRDGAFLLQALAALPLWWRRRAPLLVLTLVSAIAACAQLASAGPVATGLAIAVAVTTVASLQSTARALAGYLIAVGLPTLAGGLHAMVSGSAFSPGLLDPVLLVGLAIGFGARAARERRQAITALMEQRTAQAVNSERARIAAEMHDVVAHSLTVMIALAGGARTAWDTQPTRARQALEQLGDVGGTALEEMQRILRVLRSDGFDHGCTPEASGHDLPALDELVGTFRTAGLPVTLRRHGRSTGADPVLTTTIHRIVQEALTNALRYAHGATEVTVDVDEQAGRTVLTITDDGRTGGRVPSIGAGAGLVGIRTRTETFGGTSAAGPRAAGGWQVQAVLPRDAKAVSDA